ncbi:hypothetical protein PAXINDRAFT_14985 [Paxillus involutus ATCC 200175]|uniref:Unplaced genomic scaffold PAXINscaffold_45, whole genome shotgun sequence n=1 Tax=Paxillus involutus ATCC 200175 TaxID=664439 RepID=A0A0C9STP3_PAXIN|nr:hypothetical protein PAXINDRAFT_14985 [Paxillus involutus ATCC 200175]
MSIFLRGVAAPHSMVNRKLDGSRGHAYTLRNLTAALGRRNSPTTSTEAPLRYVGSFSEQTVVEKERLSSFDSTTTDPVLSNLFTQHPSIPIFPYVLIGLALERFANEEDISGCVLSVGEHDPRFADVPGTSKHPVTPSGLSSSRWTLAMSRMSVNGNYHTLKPDVEGTQKGQFITLIDSGTSLAYIPSDAVDVIRA